MTRRTLPTLAAALLLAACSHKSTTATPAPSDNSNMDRGAGGPGGGRGGRGGAAGAALMAGITLSADQQQRIDSIRASYRTQMEQMRASGGDRSQMRPMMERQQAEIRAVLTSDQQAVYDRNMADMRSRMEQGGRPAGPPR